MIDANRSGSFRRNVAWLFFGSASQSILSGLLFLFMGRQLGPRDFGIFSIVMGFVLVTNLLFEPRIQDVAAKQFWNFDSDKGSRDVHAQYFIDLAALEAIGKLVPFLALLAFSTLLARYGNLPNSGASLISVAAVGVYCSKLGSGVSIGLLRVLGRSDLYAYCATGELCCRLLITLLLSGTSGLTPLSCILIASATGAALNLLQWTITFRQFPGLWRGLRAWRPTASVARLRENRRLLLSNLGLSAADLMNKDLDITLISPLLPPSQVGLYKMAKNVTLLAWRIVDPVYLALMPETNRLIASGNIDGVKHLIRRTSWALAAVSLTVGLGCYLALLMFGDVVLGVSFSAVPQLVPWMLVGVVASAPLVWGHPLCVALNRADVAATGSLLGSAIGLIAFFSFVPRFGAAGAAVSWAMTLIATFSFTSGISLLLLNRRASAV